MVFMNPTYINGFHYCEVLNCIKLNELNEIIHSNVKKDR